MSSSVSGFLNVNKSPGRTSHDEVLLARRILGNKKIGHSGTLDAPASGVLVLGVGKATRLLKFITALPKKYTTELVFGETTDTGDDTGRVIASSNAEKTAELTLDELQQAADKFLGEISQTPPMYSAKKSKGVRLYELAHKGETIERDPQKVKIHSLNISQLENSKARMEVECSMGTYIRTLGYDIAQELGCEGHIRNLCRLSVGHFEINQSVALEEGDSDSIKAALLPAAAGMAAYPSCQLSDQSQIQALKNGRSISIPENLSFSGELNGSRLSSGDSDTCSVVDNKGDLIAVCEISNGSLKPRVVIQE